jgi:hypothetical protein
MDRDEASRALKSGGNDAKRAGLAQVSSKSDGQRAEVAKANRNSGVAQTSRLSASCSWQSRPGSWAAVGEKKGVGWVAVKRKGRRR